MNLNLIPEGEKHRREDECGTEHGHVHGKRADVVFLHEPQVLHLHLARLLFIRGVHHLALQTHHFRHVLLQLAPILLRFDYDGK